MKNIPSLEEQQASAPFVETPEWRNACAGMQDPAAEIQAMRAAIREAHEAFKVSLIRAYTAGYQHGHEATVEGGFIPVHHADETEFHAENIHQMMCDGSLPEASALAKLQPFLP